MLSECITRTTIYYRTTAGSVVHSKLSHIEKQHRSKQIYSMRTSINSHQSAIRVTKLNLTTRRHFIRDAAIRVKGYKMSCVYIKVLINGEIGFEKIMDV